MCAAGEESTRARLQYLSALESGGRQPRIRHDFNDLCFLIPSSEARFSGRRPQGLRRDCRHTVAPQRRTC